MVVLSAKLVVLGTNLAILGAKSAVLGAKLVVLGAKLAALGALRATPRRSWSTVGACLARRCLFERLPERVLTVNRMSCANAQVRFDSVLMRFRAHRARFVAREFEREKRRKKTRLGLENERPGRPKSHPSEPKRARVGQFERKNALLGTKADRAGHSSSPVAPSAKPATAAVRC